MKKFILKTLLLSLPILLAFYAAHFIGAKDKGDLIRMGYLINNTGNYNNIFTHIYPKDTLYDNLSSKNLKKHYTFFTIGDSFSQQGIFGYQNILVKNSKNSLLHFNKKGNAIEIIHSLLKGNVLDSIQVDYIILQSVERNFALRAEKIDSSVTISLKKAVKADKDAIARLRHAVKEEQKIKLFTDALVTFPYNNLLYLFDDNAFSTKVYKVPLTENFFSINNNDLLFYEDDILKLDTKNDVNLITKLNNELNNIANQLQKKGIKLIVLPSPDKYDIYYPFLANKSKYPEPLFFNYLEKETKNYIFINSYNILKENLHNQKDLYFYGDTHWSPYAAELISHEIINVTRK